MQYSDTTLPIKKTEIPFSSNSTYSAIRVPAATEILLNISKIQLSRSFIPWINQPTRMSYKNAYSIKYQFDRIGLHNYNLTYQKTKEKINEISTLICTRICCQFLQRVEGNHNDGGIVGTNNQWPSNCWSCLSSVWCVQRGESLVIIVTRFGPILMWPIWDVVQLDPNFLIFRPNQQMN